MNTVVVDAFNAVNLKKVPAKVNDMLLLIDAAEPIFQLKGKNLEEACSNHAQDLMFYDTTLAECKTIEDAIRIKVEEIEGELYKKYNENHSRALGTRDIQSYIKGDPAYVAAHAVLLEVVYVKRKLEAIVEALKSMGWSLGHIVKIRIAQLEDTTL